MTYFNGKSKGRGLELRTLFSCCATLDKSLSISGSQNEENEENDLRVLNLL